MSDCVPYGVYLDWLGLSEVIDQLMMDYVRGYRASMGRARRSAGMTRMDVGRVSVTDESELCAIACLP